MFEGGGEGIILHQHKIVYWVVPKCGCTSIKAWVARNLDISLKGKENKDLHDLPFERTYSWNAYPNYFHFAVVRPALERLYSLWKDKVKPEERNNLLYERGLERGVLARFYPRMYAGMPFYEFVNVVCATPYSEADPHFLPQHMLRPSKNIYLIGLSSLQDEMTKISRIFDMCVFYEARHVLSYDREEMHKTLDDLPVETRQNFQMWEEGKALDNQE